MLRVRSYFRNMECELNLKTLSLHAFAFGFFLLALGMMDAFVVYDYFNPDNSTGALCEVENADTTWDCYDFK